MRCPIGAVQTVNLNGLAYNDTMKRTIAHDLRAQRALVSVFIDHQKESDAHLAAMEREVGAQRRR